MRSFEYLSGRAGAFLALLFLVLATACPILSLADGSNGHTAPVPDEETLLFGEIPSVYAASRYSQKVTEAPSSISIVTASEIQMFGYRTLADILRSVRGFFVTDDRNYSYLGVRGFGRPGDYNTHILLLVDGHRINNNVYDHAFIGREFPVDVDLIDRVEVVRGPSSSLYGSSAFFAVVNVLTKRGRDIDGGEVSGSAGSWRTYQGRATWGKRFSGGAEGIASVSAYDSAGQDLYFPEFDNPATNNGVATGADYERSRSFFAKVSVGDLTVEGVSGGRKKGIPTGSFDTLFGDRGTYTEDKDSYLDVKYDRDLPGQANIMARAFYDYYTYYGDYVYSPADGGTQRDYGRGAWWGMELKGTKRLFDRHRVTLGGEYRQNTHLEQGTFYVDPFLDILPVEKRSGNVWAAYAQDEYRILPTLILNAGVRYDHYSTFGGTVNPRLALIWNPRESSTLKLLYGRAFRPPNAYELYYTDNATLEANPSLKPETIRTYELVLEQYLGATVRCTASLFQYRINNLISQAPDPLVPGMSIYMNMDEAKARGAELELEAKSESGFDGRIGYTWQEAEDGRTGESLTNSPKHLVKVNGTVPLLPEHLFLSPEVQYTSRRKANAESLAPYAGSFAVANLTLLGKNFAKGVELSGSVYNIFDRDYGDPWDQTGRGLVVQDDRNYRAKVTWNF